MDPWQVGDWLIDYSGGLTRRGLTGEIFFALAPHGPDAQVLVVIAQTALAAVLFILVGVLYWRTNRDPVWLMLILSPAFLLFPALDTTGNTRKELIVLVTLAVASVAYRWKRAEIGLWIGLPLFAVAVLAHEALIVTLPAFAYLAYTSLPSKRALRIITAYAIPSILSVALGVMSLVDARDPGLICQGWKERGISDCSGALAALNTPTTEIINKLITESFPGYWAYLLPIALAAVPFFTLRFLPREQLIGWTLVLAAAPLFVISWDYGRWIFLVVAQLSLLVLARPERTESMRVPLYAALAFILLWGFDHTGVGSTSGLGVRWLSSLLS